MSAKKDRVELICSVAELAACFERSDSLTDFLQEVVTTVGQHMHATVCSIYLYDEATDEVVLSATRGLDASAVGKVRLKLGEGITGKALRELRPICASSAARNPYFKLIPGIREESHQAFLAVPLLRGIERIGVLVVQHTQAGYFTEADVKALRAIAAQLAGTIENAKLLLASSRRRSEPEPQVGSPRLAQPEKKFFRGISAAEGIALGEIINLGCHSNFTNITDDSGAENKTLADFDDAVRKSEQQLEQLQTEMEQRLTDLSASLIFSAHLLMLKDDNFTGKMRHLITTTAALPATAIKTVVAEYVELFEHSPNARLREKVQDVTDIGHRLLQNLHPDEGFPDYNGQIVVAQDLLPSDMVKLVAQHAAGLILVGSGVTAHVAILARSLEVPTVMFTDTDLAELEPGTAVLLDGLQGQLFIQPSTEVLQHYQSLEADRRNLKRLETMVQATTSTSDGERVELLANVNLLHEVKLAAQLKAEGIGLYRSEFPFIIRSDFPSEEQQYRVYRQILEGMPGKRVCFRTLDIGGDKMLSYFAKHDEDNPFLGLRAIRFSLAYEHIFVEQLRALLRAGFGYTLEIMFPLIGSVDDFVAVSKVVANCCSELAAEGANYNNSPRLGVMIELPSAVELIDELAAAADFLSIGSNDLVQYILAVDRTNKHLASYYVPHHPAILRALARIIAAATRHGTALSFCGEMATKEHLLPVLIGLGIRNFSIDARCLPQVQRIISSLDSGHCRRLAEHALRLSRISEVAQLLQLPAPA